MKIIQFITKIQKILCYCLVASTTIIIQRKFNHGSYSFILSVVCQYISLKLKGWGVWTLMSSMGCKVSDRMRAPGTFGGGTAVLTRLPFEVWAGLPFGVMGPCWFDSCLIMLRRHFARAFWNHTCFRKKKYLLLPYRHLLNSV